MHNNSPGYKSQGASCVERANWLTAIAFDCSLPVSATRIAVALASYMNGKTGKAWPRQARLAADLGLGVEAIRRAVVALVAAGYLLAEAGRGSGRSTVYRMALNPSKTRGHEDCEPLEIEEEKPSKTGVKTPREYAPNSIEKNLTNRNSYSPLPQGEERGR